MIEILVIFLLHLCTEAEVKNAKRDMQALGEPDVSLRAWRKMCQFSVHSYNT
jgi:hypothetical protein